jgi:membrane protease YdiL (CAAX protease family)
VAALVAVVAVLAAVNVLNNRLAVPAYVYTSVTASALIVFVGRSAGLSWPDIGLGAEAVTSGVRWALLLAAAVAVGYVAAAALPATRRLFLDRRAENVRPRDALYQVLIRIPLGTVALEELAFRGVLFGLISQLDGAASATAVSCALFGLWHVLPVLETLRLNEVAGTASRMKPRLIVVLGVLASALAGLVLCEVRRRTGSLVPAIGLHWAVNAFGLLTAVVVRKKWKAKA